jgi:hypothetical protein
VHGGALPEDPAEDTEARQGQQSGLPSGAQQPLVS